MTFNDSLNRHQKFPDRHSLHTLLNSINGGKPSGNFFREQRESFFVDTKKVGKYQQTEQNEKNETRENGENYKSRSELQQERAQKQHKKRQEKIQKILESIENQHDFALLDRSALHDLLKYKSSEISGILEEKGLENAEISGILENLEKEETQKIQEFFAWSKEHSHSGLRSQDHALLTKTDPREFLKKHVVGDKEKRKIYFQSLAKIDYKKAETFAFVQSFEDQNFFGILKKNKATPAEISILENLHQKTLEHHTKNIFSFFEETEKNHIQSAKERAFEKAREFSQNNETLSEKTQKKEQEMLNLVAKQLGKNVAGNAEKEMKKGGENPQKRLKIFFEVLNHHAQKSIANLKKMGSEELIGAVQDSGNFYANLIQISNLSEADKNRALSTLEKTYDVFSGFFAGESNAQMADFFAENDALNDAEKNDIHVIESTKAEMQTELFALHEEFNTLFVTLNNADRSEMMKTEFFENLHKEYGVSVKLLKAYALNGDPLKPHHFPHISKKLKNMGISNIRKIDTLVEHPENIHDAVDAKVVKHWFGQVKAKSAGFMKTVSPRVLEFYASSPTDKKKHMLQKFFSVEQKIGNELVHSRSLSEISIDDELKNTYREKMDPAFLKTQFDQLKTELQETFELIQGIDTPEAKSFQKFLKNEAKEIPNPSLEEISGKNKIFSQKLTQILQKNNPKEVILEGLEDFGAQDYLGYLQEQKDQIKKHKSMGTLEYFLKNQFDVAETKHIQSLAPNLKTPEISQQEQNFLDFIRTVSPFSQKMKEGSFSQNNIRNFLQTRNKNGEYLVIPLSRTDKEIEKFEKESDSGIVFDAQSGHIIVSDELHETMQQFPEKMHARMLTHEMAHLLASDSSLEKNGRKLLKHNNILDFAEQKFLEFFPEKTGKANAVEEIFAELFSAHQFGLENAGDADFFQKNLGLGEKMSGLLRQIVQQVGHEKIQKILTESEEEFWNNAEAQKSKIAVGNEGSGLTTGEDQYGEDCDSNQQENNSEEVDSSPKMDDLRKEELQLQVASLHDSVRKVIADLNQYKSSIKNSKEAIEDFEEQAERIMEKNERDSHLPNLSTAGGADILETSEKLLEESQEFSGELAGLDGEDESYLVAMWQNTRFLSMRDLGKMWDTAYETIKRRLDTRAKRRIGEAGSNIFGGVWDGLANEFDRDVESAEKEEVSNSQGALDNKNPPQLWEFLEKANNPDDLKATVQELAERGFLDWNNPKLALALAKVGSGVTFYSSDYDNNLILEKKYKQAFSNVWDDQEMYTSLFNTNNGKTEGNVKQFTTEAAQNFNAKGIIHSMIEDKRNNRYVDAHRYEGYVRYLVDAGKGAPADTMKYLIYGVASGILPFNALQRIDDEYQNNYGLSNFLVSANSIADVKNWWREISWNAKDGKFDSPEDIKTPQMDHWIFKTVMESSDVQERLLGNLAQPGKFDHDHARILAALGNAEGAGKFLAQGSTGDAKQKTTAYTNAIIGMMQYTSSISLQKENMNPKDFRKTLARQAGYFMNFDGISSGKVNTKAKYKYTFTSDSYNQIPREGAAYNKGMKTKDYVHAQRDIYLSVVSPNFKAFLKDIAFNPEMIGDFKNIQGKVNKYKNDTQFQEAIKIAGTSFNIGSEGFELFENIIPALFEYFLNAPPNAELITQEEVNANVEAITQKTLDISNGTCNPKWENIADSRVNKDFPPPPNKRNIPHEKWVSDIQI